MHLKLLEASNRAQAAFIADASGNAAFATLLNDLLALSGSEYGFIGAIRHTPAGDPRLKIHAISDIAGHEAANAFYEEPAGGQKSLSLKSLSDSVLASAEPVIINDPPLQYGKLLAGHPPLNAFLGIPIKVKGRIVAMAGIANRPGGYDQALIDFLQPLLGTLGQLAGAAGIQQRERENAERQYLLLTCAELGTWDWDIASGRVDFNERWARMRGYRLEEIEPHIESWKKDIHPDDMPVLSNLLAEHFAGHTPSFQHEYRIRARSGEWIWISDRGMVTRRDAKGDPLHMAGAEIDITERKESEEALARTSALLGNVLDAASGISIIAADPAGVITLFNRGAELLLGYEAGEMVGKQTPAIFHLPAEVEGRAQELSETLGYPVTGFRTFVEIPEQQDSERREWTYVRKTGEHVPVSLVVTAMRGNDGKIKGYLGIAQDITLRKHKELMLRERLKESTSLYAIRHGMEAGSLEEVCRIVLEQVVMALQFPQIASSMIELDGRQFVSDHYDKSLAHGLQAQITINGKSGGWLRVFYSEDRPFLLPEEQSLLDTITNDLGRWMERRQAEDQLKQSEVFLASILDQLPSIIFVKDARELRHVHVNRVCEELLGMARQDILGKNNHELFPKERAEQFTAHDRAVLHDGHLLDIPEELIHTPQGIRFLHTKKFPIFGTDGMPQYLVGISEDITERKRAEEELRRNEERLRTIVDALPNAMLMVNAEGKISLVNTQAEHVFGYRREELLGQPIEILVPQQYHGKHSGYRAAYAHAPDTREMGAGREIYGQRKDGSVFPVEIGLNPMQTPEGRFVLASAIDITERKLAEEALAATQKKYTDIVTSTDDAILSKALDGIITTWNPAAERLFGYTEQEAIGQPMAVLFPVDRINEETEILERIQRGERIDHFETVRVRKDGKRIDVSVSISPMTDEKGRITGASKIVRDITERKKVEEKLSQFKYTLDQTLDSVFMFREGDFRFIYVNKGAQEQVGYSEAELLEMTPLDIKPEFTLERFRQTVRPLIDGTQPSLNFQTIHRHKDGHDIPVEIFLQFVREGREHGRFVAIVRDITERKRIERMKSEFISTVSHELRTPLTSISGSLGLLAGGMLGSLPAQAGKLIDIAHKNSQRLNHLINDLLDMEKIAAGKMHFDLQVQPLMPLIEQVLEATRGYGAERRVKLALISQLADAEVRVDSQRLLQVLSNLLSNAIKYSPEDGTVEVAVQKLDGRVRVSVIDHGPGIPAEFRARIFQKFSQADSSDTRQKGGTGLGLAITRELMEHMGGLAGFESVEGEGATFFCELPLASAVTTAAAGHMPLSSSAEPRILVVEDEPDVAQLLNLLLTRAGYQVDIAASGAAALQALQQSSYAAMTLDLRLPDISGLEIIRQVRQQPETAGLPIIVVSAAMAEGKLAINGDFSSIDWLAKPIDETRLLGTVEKYLAGVAGHRPRVLHVEDDADLHQVIRAMVGERYDFELAATLADARAMVALERFDVVILDLELPDGSGWDLLPLLKKQEPAPRIIILSGTELSSTESGKVEAALLKSRVSSHELLNAINTSINPSKSGGNKT